MINKLLPELLVERFDLLKEKFETNYKLVKDEFSPDSIHDLRVASRRILAFINFDIHFSETLYSQDLRKELKRLLKRLNNLRDFQVQIDFCAKVASKFPELIEFLYHLKKLEEFEKYKLQEKFASDYFKGIFGLLFFYRLEFKNKIQSQNVDEYVIISYCREILRSLITTIEQIEKGNYPTYHKVRLALKRFRYTMEILESYLGIENSEIKKLQSVQNILGSIQDLTVLKEIFSDFLLSKNLSEEGFVDFKKYVENRLIRLEDEFSENIEFLNFWKQKFA